MRLVEFFSVLSEAKCPLCGTEGGYQGFREFDCVNPRCRNHKATGASKKLSAATRELVAVLDQHCQISPRADDKTGIKKIREKMKQFSDVYGKLDRSSLSDADDWHNSPMFEASYEMDHLWDYLDNGKILFDDLDDFRESFENYAQEMEDRGW